MGWVVALLLSSVVWAQEAPPADTSASAAAETTPAEGEESDGGDDDAPVVVERKVKRVREKEADGSQAPNRFTGDPVIRSRYQLNGQSLEVDPD